MAEPYDVLASLNRMLESEERREQTRLQSSLALMQFAQQKRLQDIQLAGQQLELLQAANSQMMGAQSEAFLTESGLESLYLSTFILSIVSLDGLLSVTDLTLYSLGQIPTHIK